MRNVLLSEQMRQSDRYTIENIGIPSLVLMEKAAMGICDAIKQLKETKFSTTGKKIRVCCVCGSGNNGGDGAACARILSGQDFDSWIVFAGKKGRMSDEMKKQCKIASALGIPFRNSDSISEADIIIDAVFGTGLSRTVEGCYPEIFELINKSGAFVVSADIPSGINSDTGRIMGCAVRADLTVAIQFLKAGHVLFPGADLSGKVIVKDIGIRLSPDSGFPIRICDLSDAVSLIPERDESGNKGSFGKVLVAAGSEEICGAAVLASMAALRSGAGMVKVITHENNRDSVISALPEAMTDVYKDSAEARRILKRAYEWADVILCGPGIGTGQPGLEITESVLIDTEKPLVLDADGLNCACRYQDLLKKRKNIVLTPHLGEMSRLFSTEIGEIKSDPIGFAKKASFEKESVLVMKDARTIITSPGGDVFVNIYGSSGMATAGSGDVLSGVISAFIARGVSIENAAVTGCLIHSLGGDRAAAELGKSFMIAGDIITGIGKVMLENEI